MDKQESRTRETTIMSYVESRVSRAQLLAGVGAGLVASLIPTAAGAQGVGTTLSFPFFPQTTGTYTPEGIREIMNVLVTAAYLRATLITANITAGKVIPIPNEPPGSQLALRLAQADAAKEQYHIDFWSSLGASPVTTTFTATPVDAASFQARQEVHVALYLAAVREFAELGQPTLAKWAFQAGAEEAEQRVVSRFLQVLGGNAAGNPPNNKAFETDLLLHVRDALDLWRAQGLIGGSGPTLVYPGRDAVLAAAGPMASTVLQKTPNNAGSTVVYTGAASVNGERT